MPKDFFITGRWEDVDRARRLIPLSRYSLLGEETGESDPDNPYHHFHLFVQMKENWTLRKVLERVGVGINVQPRRGTVEEAQLYAMKDGNFQQTGNVVDYVAGQGGRTDLAAFVDDAKTASDPELWTNHTSAMVRYHRAAEKVREAFAPARIKTTEMMWIFGKSGCGKTLYVTQKWPELFTKDKTQWWNGYFGHKVVMIDELNSPVIPYDTLLEYGNKTPLRVQVKGGYVQFVAELVVIISNVPPQVVYAEDLAKNDALLRRVRFYEAESAGPHKLRLQEVKWPENASAWQPQGLSFERHVEYEDEPMYQYQL